MPIPATASAALIPVDAFNDEINDGTDCSLREAIEAANTDASVDQCPAGGPDLDTIALPAGDFELAIGAAGENSNQGGDLDLTESLVIRGQGAASTCSVPGSTCIDAGDLDRALDLRDGADPVQVTLTGLTIADGSVAGEDGGAIRSGQTDAFLTLASASVISADASNGGAIRSLGPVLVTDSLLSGNVAGTGGAISQGDSTLQVVDSLLAGNTATASGGGGAIRTSGSATPTISQSKLRDNRALAGDGGAVSSGGGPLTIATSTIEGSTALSGGGVASSVQANIDASTISGNAAAGSCLIGEGDGGGIDHRPPLGGPLDIINSTVSGNTAGCAGGGLSVFAAPAAASLTQVTIFQNAAAAGGGIRSEADVGGSSSVILRASIIAGNPGGNCAGDGARITAGFNIEDGDTCGLQTPASDRANTDPGIGPLRFNGGPTRTHLPFTTSAALNVITAGCPGPFDDQRGGARPIGGRCDVGSVEVSPEPLCLGFRATISGTAGADTIMGTADRDVIAALGGDDTIKGLGGADSICGGTGADKLVGGKGNDRLRGEEARDILLGGPGNDLLEGGPGKDKLRGGPGKNTVRP